MKSRSILQIAAVWLLLLNCALAHAFSVQRFSPQGTVGVVTQVRARFSEPMITFGAQDQPAPFAVRCPEEGAGRWLNAREWVFQFKRTLPPGTACQLSLKPGLRALAGSTASGRSVFSIRTSGPAIARIYPRRGSRIDDEQAFVLVLTGHARAESVLANAWCQAERVAERIPVTIAGDDERRTLIKHLRLRSPENQVMVLRCAQRLPADAKMSLNWGPGIEAMRDGAPTGIATRSRQRTSYRVRAEFRVTLRCERENVKSPCVPVSPLRLEFTAPIAREFAQRFTLRTPLGERKAFLDPNDREPHVSEVRFKGPFPELSELTVELPKDLVDRDGRPLANQAAFPLRIRTGDLPPLLKFPVSRFGIVEAGRDASLPVTVRYIEPQFATEAPASGAVAGEIRLLRLDSEAQVAQWYRKVIEYDETTVEVNRKQVRTREISLLGARTDIRRAPVPASKDARRPFEVLGIPLPEPGYYVVEAASRRLGESLLGKPAPMYVRTSALVTNLAVHAKMGNENALIWVTTLDRGRVAGGAQVRISDCNGREIWRGRAGEDGIARVARAFGDPPNCDYVSGWLVSARLMTAPGREDFAFTWTSWDDGIEPWRFGVPTSWDSSATVRAHSVLDRTLFRAGETVSMKHFLRRETSGGLVPLAAAELPREARLVHIGSGDEYKTPIQWHGTRWGESVFRLPSAVKKGRYQISIGTRAAGGLRVEDFRLPVFAGSLEAGRAALVNRAQVPVGVNINFLSGGSAADLPVKVSAMLQRRYLHFSQYRNFTFETSGGGERNFDQKIVADKIALKLDAQGSGKAIVDGLPATRNYYDLVAEATFDDPNGETQTLSRRFPLWPGAVVVGIKTEYWASLSRKTNVQTVVLNTAGAPQAGRTVEIRGRLIRYFSHRKRVVGGFYAYEHHSEPTDLGVLCTVKSDSRGLALCEMELKKPGSVQLVAQVKDDAGNATQAGASIWVSGGADLWFDVENHDRMDVIPEKRAYRVGETARFQVRMPFREATALIAVEREGIIETRVQTISAADPNIEVKIREGWAPNVYVSVLALRGRIRDVPWYSFFTWGWRSPIEWWRARANEYPEFRPASALVDLSKPAFRFGLAEIKVGREANSLEVRVVPEKPVYAPRQRARIRVQVRLPGGALPPAGTEVAIAAVDQALLELEPNRSWQVLEAMLRERRYAVRTSTAQMQVVGKRHYGRKALPAGGGGGRAPTRELFDTLLAWYPAVALDSRGEASIEVPLNDALTTITIAAIADSSGTRFGNGSGSLRTTQDLQLIAGLPPLVREGDRFDALVTLRNTSSRAMKIALQAKLSGTPLAERTLEIAAGASTLATWRVSVPLDVTKLDWEIDASEAGGAAADRLKLSQRVVAAVPVTVRQAKLAQIEAPLAINVAAPEAAQSGADGRPRGGVSITLQAKLAGELAGVRRWFERYPFVCLEQKTSKAIGLRSPVMWQHVTEELPAYLDRDGLAAYYPLREGSSRSGSDALTAYLLAATHESGYEIPKALRERMLNALARFVEGKLRRKHWSPREDLPLRKLAALEALSRYGRVQPLMLTSFEVATDSWPTSAVIDWYAVLKRTPAAPGRTARMAQAGEELRARLSYQGTRLVFAGEDRDYLWWLMVNGDVNAARLLLTVMTDADWREEMPRMLLGLLGRQRRGAWHTTTANLWGSLAAEKFSAAFEKDPVTGTTTARIDTTPERTLSHAWKGADATAHPIGILPWGAPSVAAPAPGNAGRIAQSSVLTVQHEGGGKPWATLLALAAVKSAKPVWAGYRISKTVTPVQQRSGGQWSRGDLARVTIDVIADANMSWVVVSDPIPAGATILGSGLGRDSAIGARATGDAGRAWPAYIERTFENYRSYYAYMPRGASRIRYTMRINNPGEFSLPPTRVEAMYAPEVFGEYPNPDWSVKP